jgi:uncharacterized protein YkwD
MHPTLKLSLTALAIVGSTLVAGATTANAGPVVGAATCGQFVGTPPSQFFGFITAMRNGTPTGEVLFTSQYALYGIQIMCLINAERKAQGLPELTSSQPLGNAAAEHVIAAAKIGWWSSGADPHTNPQTHSTPDSRIRAAGYCNGNIHRDSEIAYTWGGDPAAASPVGAVNWWMNVSTHGHRQAILDPAIRQIGIGWMDVVADGSVAATTKPAGTFVIDFGACN